MKKIVFAFALLINLTASVAQIRVAFISDPHIQDVTNRDLVRSLEVQVQSTRLFNENYFALKAALDDIASKDIQWVIISGDLTDDGQYINQEAVKQILSEYTKKHGMSFFVTVGNHDPQRPFGRETAGKDFLMPDGSTQSLSSIPTQGAKHIPDLHSAGYQEEMECYKDFGYYPQKNYLFWTTPYATYSYQDYSYERAMQESNFEKRFYTLCHSLKAPDATYLVEPTEGLWVLSIDGSVYLPDGKQGEIQLYQGSGNGYNNVIKHKAFLLSWIKRIASDAKRLNKTLVAFCHYPLAEFNAGASPIIEQFWGKKKLDLERVPTADITEQFMEAGIYLHFAGHMHVNNTHTHQGKDGNKLVNIQVPSLATGIPAYKILTIHNSKSFHIQTVPLGDVKDFDSLFPLYRQELTYNKKHKKETIWSPECLKAKTYAEFCDWQMKDLTRVRFVTKDVPEILRNELVPANAQVLYKRCGLKTKPSLNWTGLDMLTDFFRLRYSGQLALKIIPAERLSDYQELFDASRRIEQKDEFITQLCALGDMINLFLHAENNLDFDILF